jgi:hypothetical protein
MAGLIDSKILPEIEIALPCEEPNGTLCDWREKMKTTCDGEWLIKEGGYNCCSGYCLPG